MITTKAILLLAALVAGRDHFCLLEDDGLTCWQASCDGTRCPATDAVVTRGHETVVQPRAVVAGGDNTCVQAAGATRCWGRDGEIARVPAELAPAARIRLGATHACAEKPGGFTCWGTGAARAMPAHGRDGDEDEGPFRLEWMGPGITCGQSLWRGLVFPGRERPTVLTCFAGGYRWDEVDGRGPRWDFPRDVVVRGNLLCGRRTGSPTTGWPPEAAVCFEVTAQGMRSRLFTEDMSAARQNPAWHVNHVTRQRAALPAGLASVAITETGVACGVEAPGAGGGPTVVRCVDAAGTAVTPPVDVLRGGAFAFEELERGLLRAADVMYAPKADLLTRMAQQVREWPVTAATPPDEPAARARLFVMALLAPVIETAGSPFVAAHVAPGYLRTLAAAKARADVDGLEQIASSPEIRRAALTHVAAGAAALRAWAAPEQVPVLDRLVGAAGSALARGADAGETRRALDALVGERAVLETMAAGQGSQGVGLALLTLAELHAGAPGRW